MFYKGVNSLVLQSKNITIYLANPRIRWGCWSWGFCVGAHLHQKLKEWSGFKHTTVRLQSKNFYHYVTTTPSCYPTYWRSLIRAICKYLQKFYRQILLGFFFCWIHHWIENCKARQVKTKTLWNNEWMIGRHHLM